MVAMQTNENASAGPGAVPDRTGAQFVARVVTPRGVGRSTRTRSNIRSGLTVIPLDGSESVQETRAQALTDARYKAMTGRVSEDDQRGFRIGAQVPRRIGVGNVRHMTDTSARIASLAVPGTARVERVPLRAGRVAPNASCLSNRAATPGRLP